MGRNLVLQCVNYSELLSETVTVNNEILVCCAVAHLVHSLSVFVCYNYMLCESSSPLIPDIECFLKQGLLIAMYM